MGRGGVFCNYFFTLHMGLIVIEINTFYWVWNCSRLVFFSDSRESLVSPSVFLSVSTWMNQSYSDKTESKRLFPACAWRPPPLSEAKTRFLCPKASLSLRGGVCFPLYTVSLAGRLFPAAFSSSRVSFWLCSDPAGRALCTFRSKRPYF